MADLDPFSLLADINSTAASRAIFPLPEAQQLQYNQAQQEIAASKIEQQYLREKAEDLDTLAAVLGGASQGLNPFADEATAGLRSLFTGIPYSQAIQEEQDLLQAVKAASPATYKTSEYGSILASALASLPAKAAQAPSIATRVVESIPGLSTILGTKAATTLPNVIRAGATTGAIQGAGSADAGLENRLLGAGVGGVAGAALTPAFYYGGKALVQGAGDLAAKYGYDIGALGSQLRRMLSSETGAVGNIPGRIQSWAPDAQVSFDKPTAAAFEAARQLRNVRPDEIIAAEQLASEAQRLNLPLFLPEAVGTGGIRQSAQVVAQRPESIDIAKRAIEGRAAEQLDRLSGVFDAVSPEVSSYRGTVRMATAAQDIVESLRGTRAAIAKPLYDKARAEAQNIQSEELSELIAKDKHLSSAIAEVRSFGANADKPSTSLDVLDQAKRILDDMIIGAKKAGATNKARLIGETREQLVSHLDAASPTYKEARKAFENASEGLNALEKTKFKMLMDIDPTDTQKIGTLFRYEAEQIAELRQSFVKAGELEAFEAGIRGYLQRGLESKREGFDLASQFTTPAMKKKLEAALGDKAENVIKALDIEQKIAAGKREYLGGSTTRAQTTAEAELAGVAGTAQEIARKEGWGQKALGLLSQALINKPEAEFYQDLANIYFSPRAGQLLAELSPLVKALQASKAAGEVTGTIAQGVAKKGAGRSGVGTSGTKGPSKSALAVGGAALSTGVPEIEQLLADINSSVNGPAASQEAARRTTPPSKQDISALIAAKPAIIQAMVQAESSGNPNAIGPKTKSGRAQGLMQLIPSTAKALGVTDSLDPQQNIDAGEKYFDQMLEKFGSQELALAAYNWGPGNLKKAIDRLEAKKQKPTWSNLLRYTSVPEETESYVATVLGNLRRG